MTFFYSGAGKNHQKLGASALHTLANSGIAACFRARRIGAFRAQELVHGTALL